MVRVRAVCLSSLPRLTSRGQSLLQFLDNFEVLDRDINAPFMLPVSEKYNELGTCCMGKVGGSFSRLLLRRS